RWKRHAASLLLSSYFTLTDNREGAGETYDPEADLSSGVHRQHGFREGKSVDTTINELLSKIQTARRDGKHVLVLSIDIKGAFDNLQHRAILKSLDSSAWPVNINRLFHSLLQNRKVTLLTPQGKATKDQKQDCLQGSCSGPVLWNLVANEIFNQAWPDNVHIQALADDFVLVIEAVTNKSLVADTQSAITQFSSWCSENELAISMEKNKLYLFQQNDGSKTEHGVGAAFCVSTNDIRAYQWSAKLNDNNTVFQAEITALHEAVIYASHLSNHNTSKIHVDNRASIMASSNSNSTNETARKIFKILLTNPRIKVSWVKAHAGNICNERADQLAKDATQHGQPYSHTKLPKPHIKGLLRKRMLEEWQTSWKNGDTGIKIFNIIPSVSRRPTNWIREDVIFSQHGPFPAYLKKFHLSDSDYCSCDGIGTALHYATECIYTGSWHMRKSAPNFEQEWLKRVANNLV
ncbi:hypothetical protein AVEN_25403-2-1, partial [Araneus ventricosus]